MYEAFKKLPVVKQHRILNSAIRTIAEKGYDAASISTICRRAGISNGALYKYFKNKETMFYACVEYGVEVMMAELYLKYTNETDNLIDAVRNLLYGFKEFTRKHRDMLSIYSDLGSGNMNRFAAITEKVEYEGNMFFVDLVGKAVKRGEIDAGLGIDVVAHLLDSHIMLYSYSLVSDYHARRFDAFFGDSTKRLTEDQKIDKILNALKNLLRI
ncbi:MAG: TetR/AcrR family transcriptional regulator [Dehalococcoidia bacterium]|jgi:AcrR family transcriptional regulator